MNLNVLDIVTVEMGGEGPSIGKKILVAEITIKYIAGFSIEENPQYCAVGVKSAVYSRSESERLKPYESYRERARKIWEDQQKVAPVVFHRGDIVELSIRFCGWEEGSRFLVSHSLGATNAAVIAKPIPDSLTAYETLPASFATLPASFLKLVGHEETSKNDFYRQCYGGEHKQPAPEQKQKFEYPKLSALYNPWYLYNPRGEVKEVLVECRQDITAWAENTALRDNEIKHDIYGNFCPSAALREQRAQEDLRQKNIAEGRAFRKFLGVD